ncbi:MAG: trypsin-like peptidase domain-containing protein, partial [Acidobacteriota bacterium]
MRSNTAQVACLSSALLVLVVGFHSSPEARSDVLPHGPQIIGETSALRLETPHPYPEGSSSAPVVWRAGVRHPGATYITLHLERLELAPGDHLAILDRTGKEQARMTGRGPLDRGADLWTPAVDGEIAILELRAGGMRTTDDRFGLIVDRYAHGFEPIVPADGGTDAVCGSDQRRDAICYSSSHPTEYDKARAVGRLLINGTGTCTGWLVSCEGHMMTANHCLASQSAVENTEIRMMYERSGCGTGDESWDRVLHGKDLVRSSSTAGLDYTLFTVVEDASEYGFFGLDPRLPREGERIYLPAHHGGQVKRFGIESDNEPEGVCRVTESPFLLNSEDILYYCDTTGSSSGAPVVSGITHRVLALNRTQTEGCAYGNQGARVDLIFPEIRDALPACLFSPDFVLDSSELLDDTTGNGSGLADPGETLRWKITLENRGTSPSTATVGTLTSEHLFVNILDGEADFTDIPDGASGSTLAPHFEVRIGRGVACGSRIPFTLAVEADEGSAIVPLLLEIGDNLGGPLFYSATDVPVAIPNGSSAGVTSSIDVPELFAVADVFAQPDISHTYVGDLTLELTSPASTTARLHAKTGWSRD